MAVHPNLHIHSPMRKGLEPLLNHCINISDDRCDKFYDLPIPLGKNRSAGIGKGHKVTFGDSQKCPAPGNYNLKSMFDDKKKGIKFSLGR